MYNINLVARLSERDAKRCNQLKGQRNGSTVMMTPALVYTALVKLYRRVRLATEKTRTLRSCVICYQSIRNRPTRSPMILSLQGS